jgi:hypothetical protein
MRQLTRSVHAVVKGQRMRVYAPLAWYPIAFITGMTTRRLPMAKDDGGPALKPCPWCGGEAAPNTITYDSAFVKDQGWNQDTFHGVNCISCGASNRGLVGFKTPDEAIKAWNARAMPPEVKELVEAVKSNDFIRVGCKCEICARIKTAIAAVEALYATK